MKTVIDAVNEFKGKWSNAEYGYIDVRFIFECTDNKDVTNCTGRLVGDEKNNSPENYREVCSKGEFNRCVDEMSKAEWIKPVTPIYTQLMADNGELPLVGMDCWIALPSSKDRGVITYMGQGVGVYRLHNKKNEYSFSFHSVRFKPVVSDLDQAKDDIHRVHAIKDGNFYNRMIDAIKAGKIHGVTFTGES